MGRHDIAQPHRHPMNDPVHPLAPPLIEFLRERFPGLPPDFGADDPLLDSGAVDSLGVVEIVAFLEDRFGVILGEDDLSPERFRCVSALLAGVDSGAHAG
jgi:acyl carrier protein